MAHHECRHGGRITIDTIGHAQGIGNKIIDPYTPCPFLIKFPMVFSDCCLDFALTRLNACVAVTGRKRTLSGLIRLVISLECFIEITPDFLCPFMND